MDPEAHAILQELARINRMVVRPQQEALIKKQEAIVDGHRNKESPGGRRATLRSVDNVDMPLQGSAELPQDAVLCVDGSPLSPGSPRLRKSLGTQ